MRRKLLVSLAFITLLAACGNGNGKGGASSSSTSVMSSASSMTMMQSSSYPGWQSYSNPGEGYSIQYPPTFTLQTNVVTTVATTTGTIIAFPASFQPGTAYDEAKVEITNNVGPCGVVPGDVLTQTGTQITISGVHYDVSSGVGVGAGQLYQTYVYDVSQYGMCHRFALFIHSCNLGPDCGAGHTKPLDKLGVINAFEKILSTVSFLKVPGATTGTGSSMATASGSAASL